MKYPKRGQYKHANSPYRVRNWSGYEAGLGRRGDLTVWLSDAALESRPCLGRLLTPSHRSRQTVRTTPRLFTKPPVSEAKDERCASSSHLAVTPSSARTLRPHCGNGIATFGRSENSGGASGTRPQATASAAWSRIPCTDTRRSSVEVCEVEPWMDNDLRFNWRAKSSTR